VTGCHVSAAGARAERKQAGLESPPSPYGAPGADEDIADFEDNPDDVRLPVTAKLVVWVTRPEILRKHAADTQRAMAEVHSPGERSPICPSR
jgi:hypothetical protein